MEHNKIRERIRTEIQKAMQENIAYTLQDENVFDDIPSVTMYIDDSDGTDKAFFEISSMYHGDNGKMTVLKNNPALQQAVAEVLQKEIQKTFRRVVHGILGEPFGLKEVNNKK
jgi:hypothetical protein